MEMNAQGLASLGRGGDDQIGHLTTGEKVLPLPVAQDPSVQRVINESFAEHGLDANQYTVGHANNSVNPDTQYAEFGLFKKIGKALRKVGQVIGTVVGFIYGGPAGAALGSTIGGANRRGKFDLKHAVTDAIGGYTLGSMATGMGMVGGTGGLPGSGMFGGQGIGGLKAAFTPASAGGMWGWGATPSTAGGIGGFFQNVGARGASMLPGGGGSKAIAGTPAANLFGKGGAYQSLDMWQKAGVMGIGALAAGKMGAFEQPGLEGRPEGGGLTEQQKQYLTKPLTPATTMPGVGGVGGSSSGQMGQYQGGAGIGGLNNPNQALLDFLEEQKRKYLMQFPSFQTGQRQFGYNQGGPVPRQGYAKGGEVDTVPAMLTEDEHVLTVDAIKGLGGGDIEKGHQIAKQLNDSAEEKLQDQILERKYFMQFPEFNRGVA